MQKAIETAERPVSLGLIVAALLPFGLGYFFSYLYRAVNAVVAPDLVRDVGLTAGELGLLTSAYLLSFALFQLPLGILLDRFGPRRVQAGLVAVGAIGALLFSIGQDVWTLAAARAVIGIGFAGGLMASFKAVVLWVPEARRALANSIVMSGGAVGVILASAPMEWGVRLVGWRQSFVILAGATFVVALLILLIVPEKRGAAVAPSGFRAQLRDVARIYGDPVFLSLAPVLAIPAGAHIALQTLWAGPWLRDVAGFSRIAVGEGLFVMGVAFLVGVLASGVVADRMTRRGWSLLDVNLMFLGVYFGSQVAIILEAPIPPVLLWSLFAMTGHTAVLAYPWLAGHFGAALSARSNTAVNLLMFGFAFAVQYAVGWVIDLFPAPAAGRYDPAAYRAAFGILLAIEISALIWFLARRGLLARAEAARGQSSSIGAAGATTPGGRRYPTGPAT